MYTVFLIPYEIPNTFVVFGSEVGGHKALHVFTDEGIAFRTLGQLPPATIASRLNVATLVELIGQCQYTHVCLNQSPNTTVHVAGFIESLPRD
jgi:hypothetical protein